jgi:hypothetical protein
MSLIRASPDDIYWAGGYSYCYVGRDIESYVQTSIQTHSAPISFIFSKSDGFFGQSEYDRLCSEFGRRIEGITEETRYTDLEQLKQPGTYPLIGCLCSRFIERPTLIHLPLDDETFRVGLEQVLSGIPQPAWEDRISTLFWRGAPSGFDRPSLRVKVASALASHPHADVRITPWGGWETGQGIPSELFAPRCDLATHFRYKYLLIVDGNCIASNHQWVFGSGAVPVMVTHPNNRVWFQTYVIPMVHYVPVAYDLSNLAEMIDYLVANDAIAKRIAENAQALARTIFSPSFQRTYIDEEIARGVGESHLHQRIEQE